MIYDEEKKKMLGRLLGSNPDELVNIRLSGQELFDICEKYRVVYSEAEFNKKDIEQRNLDFESQL